jgi:tryptophan 2,3-dioxygenase
MNEATVTDYERYLQVPRLLELQKPREARSHEDELLFQVVHQVEELWFKVVVDDVARTVVEIEAHRDQASAFFLGRMNRLVELMTAQLELIGQMAPRNYLAIRKGLGRGSGQQSPGFNAMLEALPSLSRAFSTALERRRLTLLDVYADPCPDRGALAVAEGMIALDTKVQGFRYAHWMLVKRVIGARTRSLQSKPLELLEQSMKTPFFPELWEVRCEIFEGFMPGKMSG